MNLSSTLLEIMVPDGTLNGAKRNLKRWQKNEGVLTEMNLRWFIEWYNEPFTKGSTTNNEPFELQ